MAILSFFMTKIFYIQMNNAFNGDDVWEGGEDFQAGEIWDIFIK